MRRQSLVVAVAIAVGLAFTSSAPALRADRMAPAGQAASFDAAVRLYRDAVARDEIKGAVLYVARRGQVVLFEAVGFRHEAYRLPMERDTLFRMASNTKPVVAAAILMLADEGRLAVSDPVSRHLSSYDNDKSRAVTIEQLLTHSSGLRIGPIFHPFEDDEERTLQTAVAKFGAEGPAAAPGEYAYNNAGYNTLGAIIEVVSGQPLEVFLKSRIYDPLGMVDTLNHEDPAKLHRMATVYRGRRSGGRGGPVVFTQGFTPGDAPDFPVIRASGGMISTVADYARFLEMYRHGGELDGRRYLREATVRAALTGRVKSGANTAYAYGWMMRDDGSYYHTGSDGTMAWVDPAREIVGMVFTQSPGGANPSNEFRELVNRVLQQGAVAGSRSSRPYVRTTRPASARMMAGPIASAIFR
ncbi:MAG TPA: serine hydrolase domain-containing protein [Vicinamibacterales bacterium]|nr:serine hydrolase domain-containing protein [Vicinamibacterales bacterium]